MNKEMLDDEVEPADFSNPVAYAFEPLTRRRIERDQFLRRLVEVQRLRKGDGNEERAGSTSWCPCCNCQVTELVKLMFVGFIIKT